MAFAGQESREKKLQVDLTEGDRSRHVPVIGAEAIFGEAFMGSSSVT